MGQDFSDIQQAKFPKVVKGGGHCQKFPTFPLSGHPLLKNIEKTSIIPNGFVSALQIDDA